MAHEVVKYHNDMASVSLPGFTAVEHDILAALCYAAKDKGTDDQEVSISRLKELAGYTSKDDARFIRYLDDLSDRIFNLQYRENKQHGGFKKFVLFTKFETEDLKTERARLIYAVGKDFEYILNNSHGALPLPTAGYTSFELQQHNALSSSYSKACFKQLKRFKRTGWWFVPLGEFKRLLDIPDAYRFADINKRVLSHIEKELPQYFDNLKIEQVKGGKSGRLVEALKFTFTPQTDKGIWNEREIKKTEFVCRFCGEPLYAITNRGTGEQFYGHKDGWKHDAPCRQTFGSVDEILGKNESPENTSPYSEANEAVPEKKEKKGGIVERTGFTCKSCGRPLYKIFNSKGEMFYGHPDGAKEDAACKMTYSTVAEIRGYSETPTRADYSDAYNLYEENEVNRANIEKINAITKGLFGTFETIKNED